MADDWSRAEVEAAVADYFDMLSKWLRGEPFNKAEHNRALQKVINRTRPSIEWKHRNISAVLLELGCPDLPGYKPAFNYQELLRLVVQDRLNSSPRLHEAALFAVERRMIDMPQIADILSIVVPPPVPDEQPKQVRDVLAGEQRGRRNYLELEARNSSLGLAGEEFVLTFEHERLWRAGQRKLAERIDHVAQSRGDHLGYDVLSFEDDGRDRLIEVKTTQFGEVTPFFASRNEVTISRTRQEEYHLYRLFNFGPSPGLYMLSGSLAETCLLEPTTFTAIPKQTSYF
jgi:hypothetical protein